VFAAQASNEKKNTHMYFTYMDTLTHIELMCICAIVAGSSKAIAMAVVRFALALSPLAAASFISSTAAITVHTLLHDIIHNRFTTHDTLEQAS
jgi:hypothetical protein